VFAVIKTGGKQYKVAEGDEIYVEKLESQAGDKIEFETVMTIAEGKVTNGGKVTGKVVKNGKQKKIIVFKMKPKKNYKRKQGHRQPYTKIVIESIS
jgi:large subunit ribosomal protein L21